MPLLPDTDGFMSRDISLKAATFGQNNETAAYAVDSVDSVRVQAWETGGAAWDSGTADLQGSLDGAKWVDLGVSLTADGITAKTDVQALPFIRLVKGTDASSTTPIIRVIVYGEVEN